MSTAPSIKSELVKFIVEITKGPHVGQTFEFEKSSITIGRGPENHITLSDDPRVSRNHAEIKQSMGQFYLVNLSQKNFVLLNGQNVTSEKIENKSTIQIGETEFKFIIPGSTNLLEPIALVASVPNPMPTPNIPRPPGSPLANQSGVPASPHMGVPSPHHGHYQHSQQQSGGQFRPVRPQQQDNSKMRFYMMIVVIGGVLFFLMSGNKTRKASEKPFRSTEELETHRIELDNDIKAFQERKDKMKVAVYQKAYENFLRGYRDYRQGQYARAKEAFQLVLNLDPENELAKRYYNLSKIRFDEMIKFNLLQGRRYLEKQNYRMCRSYFQKVMTMLGSDPSNSEYNEAKRYHEQCSIALEARY